MKFYKLEYSITIKEIGYFPQAPDVKLLTYNTGSFGKNPINVELVPPEPILKSEARQTTFLSVPSISSANFLVLKRHFLDFLSDFNIGHYQTWPIKVHYKKEVLDEYLLFHLSYPSDDKTVNYSNSEFLIGKLGDWKDPGIRKPVRVENHQNYLSLKEVLKESEDNSQIRCNKLILDFGNAGLDVLRLTNVPFGLGYYVSERLKNAILEERFTGMDFVEIEEHEKRIVVKNTNHGNTYNK